MDEKLTRRQVLKLGATLGVAGGGVAVGLPSVLRAQSTVYPITTGCYRRGL